MLNYIQGQVPGFTDIIEPYWLQPLQQKQKGGVIYDRAFRFVFEEATEEICAFDPNIGMDNVRYFP